VRCRCDDEKMMMLRGGEWDGEVLFWWVGDGCAIQDEPKIREKGLRKFLGGSDLFIIPRAWA
jgi:hypothetical protein